MSSDRRIKAYPPATAHRARATPRNRAMTVKIQPILDKFCDAPVSEAPRWRPRWPCWIAVRRTFCTDRVAPHELAAGHESS